MPAQAQNLSDTEIAQAIRHQMIFDSSVPRTKINVTVNDGIAELTGTVDNVLAKERATRLAELVKGVRSVSNRLEVQPAANRTDEQIQNDVKWALAMDSTTESWEVTPKVKNGHVTLTGTVQSYAEKAVAGRVAKGVRGVLGVENQLGIDYQENRSDEEIQRDIRARLHWDALVDDGLVDATVKNGHVTLSGTVGSATEKRRATWDAWVFGVSAVDNKELDVKWWAKDEDLRAGKFVPKTDKDIAQAIRDAALFDPRVSSIFLEPEVDNGWVTLKGSVDNYRAKKIAKQLARNTVGATGVTNLLDVRPVKPSSDAAIAADVRAALIRNPYTDSYQIAANVDDGDVTLTGWVETPFERAEAVRVASSVDGVRNVEDQIESSGKMGDLGTSYYFDTLYPQTITVYARDLNDSEIREEINDELFWSPFVDSDNVNVTVMGGVATLTGTVESWSAYRAAEQNAFEGGATRVENELQVESETASSSE